MPARHCTNAADGANNPGLRESLAAICNANFVVTTIISLLMMTDYYLIFVTGTAYVQQTFGASLSTAGLSSGTMVIGCLVGRFITGNQISTFGGRRCLLAGLLIFAASIAGQFFISSLGTLFALRFATGFAVGVAGTATGTIVAYVVPVRFHGLGISLFTTSTALALAFGPFLGISVSLRYGHHTLMVVDVCIAALCMLCFLFLRNLPPMRQRQRPPFSLYSYIDPRVVRFSLVALVACPSYGCIQAFLPSFAAERGLSGPAGAFFLCYAGAALFTRPKTGRLFDQRGENIVLYPALLLTALALFVLSRAQTPAMLLGAGLLMGTGFANFQSVGQAVALSMVSRSRFPQATTTFYIFFDLGIGIGPFVFGHVASVAGYGGMYLTLSLVVLAAVGIYRLVHNGRH